MYQWEKDLTASEAIRPNQGAPMPLSGVLNQVIL